MTSRKIWCFLRKISKFLVLKNVIHDCIETKNQTLYTLSSKIVSVLKRYYWIEYFLKIFSKHSSLQLEINNGSERIRFKINFISFPYFQRLKFLEEKKFNKSYQSWKKTCASTKASNSKFKFLYKKKTLF
jgi:hypothetical protein